MQISKILVGIDFSQESEAARRHAVHLARTYGAEIVLAHAHALADTAVVGDSAQRIDELATEALNSVRAELEQLRERTALETPGPVTMVLLEEHPDPGLANTAEELDADMVVVGTHGRTGFKRLMLGSVAERTVRHCLCSALVARRAPVAGGYRHVLVPTDFSIAAEQALSHATDLVAGSGAIDVLHCWQLPMLAPGYPEAGAAGLQNLEPVRAQTVEEIELRAKDMIARHRDRHPRIEFRHTEDVPTQGILRALEAGDYDLVAMGSHGRRGLRRWLLGSVAESVVRHASCSVLVTHAPQQQQQE